MRLLFVSPDSAPNTPVLARIASGFEVEIADGALDRAGIERALRTPADVVCFFGHGERSILHLSDDRLDAADLVSMLGAQKSARLFLVIACDSMAVATAIHNALHCPTVAFDAPVHTPAAVQFATVFFRRYKQGGQVQESFEAAKQSLLSQGMVDDALLAELINGDMATDSELSDCMRYVKTELAAVRVEVAEVKTMVHQMKGRQTSLLLVLVGLLLLAQLATPFIQQALR